MAPTKSAKPQPAPEPLIPGFGPKSTQALARIGITTLDQLRALDPYQVYAELKKQVPGTSRNFLYGLIAAHEQIDWRVVSKTRGTEILMRLDDMGLAPK